MFEKAARILCILIFLNIGACCSDNGEGQVGEIFPKFSSKMITGGKIDSKIFQQHKLTILNFWATWCTGCIKELPYFETFSKDKENSKIAVYGVITDPEESLLAKNILKQKKITFKQIEIPDNVKKKYRKSLTILPLTFIIDQKQKIVFRRKGSISKDELEKVVNKLINKEK